MNDAHANYGISPLDEHNLKLLSNAHPPEWVNPEPMDKYNLIVIGGGSAGLVAAAGAAGLGAKVALIERYLLGGDCLNTGCVPSKAVIRASRVVSEIKNAHRFGIEVSGETKVDFGAVMGRMRKVRASLSPHDSAYRFKEMGIDVFFGEACFTGPNCLVVDGAKLHFKNALIATGSRAIAPPIEGLSEVGYITNESVFNLTERPARLGVIGAGPIGCELGQAFSRLGSEVTLFNRPPQIMAREDKEAAQIVQSIFEEEGIGLQLGVNIKRVTKSDTGKVLHFKKGGELHSVEVDEILVAAGRTPNVESLGMEAAGVDYHKKGLVVTDTLQTTNPSIYGAGDVALKYQFTHMADISARMVLRNAFFPGPKQKVSDLIIPWVTYTDPEVAHVGMYEYEAHEKGVETDTYKVNLEKVDRAIADGETAGFVKVMTKKGSDKILGATIVATHAGEMINEITLAMTQNIGLGALVNVIHPYPTQAEAIRHAANLYNRTRLTPTVSKLFDFWFDWTR
ncbi:MAG: mercuric reductase [Ardenticatenaceae bacterium]